MTINEIKNKHLGTIVMYSNLAYIVDGIQMLFDTEPLVSTNPILPTDPLIPTYKPYFYLKHIDNRSTIYSIYSGSPSLARNPDTAAICICIAQDKIDLLTPEEQEVAKLLYGN